MHAFNDYFIPSFHWSGRVNRFPYPSIPDRSLSTPLFGVIPDDPAKLKQIPIALEQSLLCLQMIGFSVLKITITGQSGATYSLNLKSMEIGVEIEEEVDESFADAEDLEDSDEDEEEMLDPTPQSAESMSLPFSVKIHVDHPGPMEYAAAQLVSLPNYEISRTAEDTVRVPVNLDSEGRGYIFFPIFENISTYDEFVSWLNSANVVFSQHLILLADILEKSNDEAIRITLNKGLIYNPMNWLFPYRFGETPELRDIRRQTFLAFGEAVWRYMNRDVDTLEDFIDMDAFRLMGFEKPWSLRRLWPELENGKRLLRDWIDILNEDYKRLKNNPLYQPLPEKFQISDVVNFNYFDLLNDAYNRGVLEFDGFSSSRGSGLHMGIPRLQSKRANQINLYVYAVARNWFFDKDTAKEALRKVDQLLGEAKQVLMGSEGEYYNVRITFEYIHEFNTTVKRIDEAMERITRLQQRHNVTQDYLDKSLEYIGAALASIDMFFYIEDSTSDLVDVISEFMAGLEEGLGPDIKDKALAVFKENLQYPPVSLIMTEIQMVGIVYGALEHIGQMVEELYGVLSHPEEALEDAIKMIKMLFETQLSQLARIMGVATGESIQGNLDNLLKQPSSFHFAFETGRILGPLVLDVIIGMIVEAWIIGPLLKKAAPMLRAAFAKLVKSKGPEMDIDLDLFDARRLDDWADNPKYLDEWEVEQPISDEEILEDLFSNDQSTLADYREQFPDQEEKSALEILREMKREKAEASMVDGVDSPQGSDSFGTEMLEEGAGKPVKTKEITKELEDLEELLDDFYSRKNRERDEAVEELLQELQTSREKEDAEIVEDLLQHMSKRNELDELFSPDMPEEIRDILFKDFVDKDARFNGLKALLDDPEAKPYVENAIRQIYDANPEKVSSIVGYYTQQAKNKKMLTIIGKLDPPLTQEQLLSLVKSQKAFDDGITRIIAERYDDFVGMNEDLHGLSLSKIEKIQDHWFSDDMVKSRILRHVDGELRVWGIKPRKQPRGNYEYTNYPGHPDRAGTAEGWVSSTRRGGRSKEAGDIQKEIQRELRDQDLIPDGQKSSWDATHLVPDDWFGEASRLNVVPANNRINRSYIKMTEQEILRLQELHGDIYLRVDITGYDVDGFPTGMRYRCYTDDGAGNPVEVLHHNISPNTTPVGTEADVRAFKGMWYPDQMRADLLGVDH